jgi:hypothetical protein
LRPCGLVRDPRDAHLRSQIAVSHYFERDYVATVAAARHAIAQHPEHPLAYRWLAAAIVEPPTRILAPLMSYDAAFDRVSTLFYFAAITAMLWSLFALLGRWFTDEAALIAALVAACTIRRRTKKADRHYSTPTWSPHSHLIGIDDVRTIGDRLRGLRQ